MTAKKLDYYQDQAREMIENDAGRDKLHEAMETEHHLEWELPAAVKSLDWVRKFIDTSPFDALRAGTRVMSTVAPKIKLQPLNPNPENKKKTNRIEKALGWWLMSANRRGKAKVVSDIMLSALRHDEVCAQVVFLDEDMKGAAVLGLDTKHYEMARRYGPFAVLVRNPRSVHYRYSDWMLESVVYVQTVPIHEVVAFWGDLAKKVKKEMEDSGAKYVTIYDYWDTETRAVWCYTSEMEVAIEPGDRDPIEIIKPTEHKLDFIPWVVRVGGTNLDSDPKYQRYPLLYATWKGGQWVNRNIIKTLAYSEVISHAAAPRIAITSADPNNPPTTDYGDPAKNINLRPGEQAQQLTPPQIDQALLAVDAALGNDIERSTIPAILQGAGIPSGVAFSTLNLATQSGIKAIAPHKALAEDAIADILAIFLYWIHYSGKPLVAYGTGKSDDGEQYMVSPDDFDVDNLYITTELTADVPTDRMGRINAAAIAVERLGYPRENGLEDIGVEDPQEAMRASMYEALERNALEIAMKNEQAQAQLKIQLQAQQMQMMLQQQQQQQMMAAQQAAQQQQQQQSPMGGAPYPGQQMPGQPPTGGMPGIGGPGFNPAQGGMPPAQANPYATREQQTGMARGGVPIEEEGVV